jgi:hypothetical protein
MLTLEQVREILNVESSLVYPLVYSVGLQPGNSVGGVSGGCGK